MKAVKMLIIIVVGVFVLLSVVGFLKNRFPMNTVPRLSEMSLLEDKLESDHLFQELETIAASIHELKGDLSGIPLSIPENDLNMHILQNGSVLASFHLLFRQKYMADLSIEGQHSRTPMIQTFNDPFPAFGKWRDLSDLLLCQAHHKLKNGLTEEGCDALEAVSQINLAILQNPSMVELMLGLNRASQFNRYLVQSGQSLCVETDHWIPESLLLLKGYEQALYGEYVLMENLFESEDLQGSVRSAFVEWGSKFLFNKEESIGYLSEDFSANQQAFKEGILRKPDFGHRFNRKNPLHWFFNPVGRIMLDVGTPNYFKFSLRVYISIWQSDATRLVISLRSLEQEQNQANTMAAVARMSLINPLTCQPYSVSEDGRLELLPFDSEKWDLFEAKYLDELSGFPVVLPASQVNDGE